MIDQTRVGLRSCTLFVHTSSNTEKMKQNNKTLPDLKLCILFDIIGCLSFSIPFIGEFSDVIWAPLSGLIYYRMFGGKMGVFGGAFSFLEEILPFTDIIPTFTISWFIRSREISKSQVSIMWFYKNFEPRGRKSARSSKNASNSQPDNWNFQLQTPIKIWFYCIPEWYFTINRLDSHTKNVFTNVFEPMITAILGCCGCFTTSLYVYLT